METAALWGMWQAPRSCAPHILIAPAHMEYVLTLPPLPLPSALGPRWFVLAVESGYLYYFKSPSEMSSPGVSPKVRQAGGGPRGSTLSVRQTVAWRAAAGSEQGAAACRSQQQQICLSGDLCKRVGAKLSEVFLVCPPSLSPSLPFSR